VPVLIIIGIASKNTKNSGGEDAYLIGFWLVDTWIDILKKGLG